MAKRKFRGDSLNQMLLYSNGEDEALHIIGCGSYRALCRRLRKDKPHIKNFAMITGDRPIPVRVLMDVMEGEKHG